jgi:hypothetical protein
MREFLPIFSLIFYSFMGQAEVLSAKEFQQDCFEKLMANCVVSHPNEKPLVGGDDDSSTGTCQGTTRRAEMENACKNDTKLYCASFSTPGPTAGSQINPPAGCTVAKAKPPPPPPPPDPNTHGKKLVEDAQADLNKCQSMQSTQV